MDREVERYRYRQIKRKVGGGERVMDRDRERDRQRDMEREREMGRY